MPYFVTTWNYRTHTITNKLHAATNIHHPHTTDPETPQLIHAEPSNPDNDSITYFIHAPNNPKAVIEFTHQLIEQSSNEPLAKYHDHPWDKERKLP